MSLLFRRKLAACLVLPAAAAAAMPVPAAENQRWTLVAESLTDAESARLEAQGYVEMGLPSEVRPLRGKDGQPVYRVVVGNFATRQEAAAYAEPLKRDQGMVQLWVAPY